MGVLDQIIMNFLVKYKHVDQRSGGIDILQASSLDLRERVYVVLVSESRDHLGNTSAFSL